MNLDTAAGPVLYLDGVTVSFDGFRALNGLTFVVEPGELRCVIGPNGAGKTTMMDVITGKTRPDTGDVFFGQANDLTRMSETEIATLGIGRKFQKPTVFRNHTVWENLELALDAAQGILHTLSARLTSEQEDRIDAVLGITGLREEAHRTADLLSHGQKQWLEIGILLMQDPKLLLLDEPVAGMTDYETGRTAELVQSLAGKHSVVVVEHDMQFVGSIARTVTVLHEGKVLAEGPMDRVRADDRVVELVQYYGGSNVLRGIDLDVPQGSCVALLGRNGVGKTTLLRCIMGMLQIRSGTVRFDGKDLTRLSPFERARLGIGYVPQGREIFPRLTVAENIAVGESAARGRPTAPLEELFALFPALQAMQGRRGGDLSGGQQQQLAIIRALVARPSLLLLDEPTEGIQPSLVKDIERVLRLLQGRGMTILLVEQYVEFARALAQDYAILDRGEVVGRGRVADLRPEEMRRHLAV